MRAIVLLSGGLDSSVLAYHLVKALGHEVDAVSVDYRQRHRCELRAAQCIARELGIRHNVVDLSSLCGLIATSALTGGMDVPHGHYEADSMRATVVPNRNMMMVSIAGAIAASRGAKLVAVAVHAGDHAIYPDCRPVFIDRVDRALAVATEGHGDVRVIAPFVRMTKADIVRAGHELGVPFALTWSCYEGGKRHCGFCGTCVERREAFALANVPDPTEYEPIQVRRSG